MNDTTMRDVRCARYELEIPFRSDVDAVWQALLEDTNTWWLPDFHMVDAASEVVFDVTPGGRGLCELRPDGSFLQWYAVQSFLPARHTVHLVGYLSAAYGGPSTSHLTLSLEVADGGTVLRVSDSHVGPVEESTIAALRGGWRHMFEDGLRAHVA